MRPRIQRHLRLCRREIRPTFRLALPIVGGMVSQMLMGLADAVMIGRVGVVPLAASTLVHAITHLPLVFGIGLLSSIAVLASQAYGARRPAEAGEILRHGLVISSVTGIAATLAPIFLVRPFLHRLGQPPEVVEAAQPYMNLFAVSICPALIAHGCKQFSDALKHPWVPTLILLGGVLLNVLLNWVLIYGNLGFPPMGLVGAGWATVLARVAILVAMLVYVLRGSDLRGFHPVHWGAAMAGSRFGRLLHLGWPVAAQHFMEVSAFAFAALMMGWISANAIAAHQISIMCASGTFMFALGIGQAASIRVGHAFGAGQRSRMHRIGFSAAALGSLIMGMFGLIFVLAGSTIAGWFVQSTPVINLAAQLLFVAAIFQVMDGIQVVSISALRGLNDVRVPAMIALLAYWALALPIGFVLAFPAGIGAVGIWIGLATGLGVAAIALSWRFHRETRAVCPRGMPDQETRS